MMKEIQMMPLLIALIVVGLLWFTVVQFVASNITKVVVYLVLFELITSSGRIVIRLNQMSFRDIVVTLMIVVVLLFLNDYISVFNKSLILFACIKGFQFCRQLSIKQLYFPTAVTPEQDAMLKQSPLISQIVGFESGNQLLSGIYVHGENFHNTQPILYCHGNAGNIYDRIQFAMAISQSIGCDMLLFDYRCFGNSSYYCKLDQEGIINDAVAAFYELKKLYKLKKERYGVGIDKGIKPIIFGNSLGGAVAIHTVYELLINSQDDVSIGGLIIQNTFTSAFEIASYLLFRCNWFKWILFPIMAHRWNSIQCISDLNDNDCWRSMPKLFLSGKQDRLINPVMMQQLVTESRRYQNSTLFGKFEEGDHNNMWHCQLYFNHLGNFVSSCSML